VWATLQQESFLIGAALVLICQAAKFSQLNPGDPVTSRYVALLPGAQVRDFAGPYAYHIAFAAFLGASFVAYFLVCQISPDILKGVATLFGSEQTVKAVEGIPYPLYVAALFTGLTQPVVPVLSRFVDAQRNFFHGQIEVPRRVIDLSDSLTTAIEKRSGADRKQAANEVRRLAGGEFLLNLQSYGDVAFYKLQLEKLELDNGALEQTLKRSSLKDLRGLIERLVLYALVAVMRRSGPKALTRLVKYIDADVITPPRTFGYLLASFVGSGVLFCLGLLIIAHGLAAVDGFVASLFGKTSSNNLWPEDLANVGLEFWAMVPPIFVCLVAAISLLVPREQIQSHHLALRDRPASLGVEFVNFFRASGAVLGLCIVISLLIKTGQLFYEYGSFNLPHEARSALRLILPMVQSFIPVAVCLFATWYLVSSRECPRRGLSFAATLLAIASSTSVIAFLYDLTFIQEYVRVHPDYAPGWEHVLFSIVANALVSMCAFTSVAIFFKARTTLSDAMNARDERGSVASSRQNGHLHPTHG
jgi:hypothetical protein